MVPKQAPGGKIIVVGLVPFRAIDLGTQNVTRANEGILPQGCWFFCTLKGVRAIFGEDSGYSVTITTRILWKLSENFRRRFSPGPRRV